MCLGAEDTRRLSEVVSELSNEKMRLNQQLETLCTEQKSSCDVYSEPLPANTDIPLVTHPTDFTLCSQYY